ncbi:rCG28856 [Rattus norvegicus]|uniref:RCG28856 n=1 Tax=Rattus norvegicus TaxID=10116 RepID=A6HUV6_RAT|nr:rCG28856 [Rattus norvegicus]
MFWKERMAKVAAQVLPEFATLDPFSFVTYGLPTGCPTLGLDKQLSFNKESPRWDHHVQWKLGCMF